MPIWSPENVAEKLMVMPLKVSVGAIDGVPLLEPFGVVVVVLLTGFDCELEPVLAVEPVSEYAGVVSVDMLGELALVPVLAIGDEAVLVLALVLVAVGELVLVVPLLLVALGELLLVPLVELELELGPELFSNESAESPPEP
jgi:hypothetical protein